MAARFVEADGGFDLWLGDQLLIRHRIDAPAIRIACGQSTVKMVRGNFRLDDILSDERVPVYARLRVSGDRIADVYLSDAVDGPPLVRLSLCERAGGLLVDRVNPGDGYDRLTIDFHAEPDDVVWGGGEQMSYLTLNGRCFPMWTSEPGVGREPGSRLTDMMSSDGSFAGGDFWTTNYPQPTLLVSRGFAVHVDTSRYVHLDCRDSSRHRILCWQADCRFLFFEGADPAELQSRISDQMGRQPSLPDWAIGGAIVGLKDGSNSFARLERIIAAGAIVSGLWCEDWVGIRQTSFGRRLFWDWQWNSARYPDLPQRIADLKALGIRFLGYVNPYLAVDGPQYAEAAELGYLARRLDRDAPYVVDFGEFDAGVVDFTNGEAAEWFSETIIARQMLDFGLDGWMADFGEYLPVDLRLHDGDPMAEHNRWPVRWAKVNADAVASRGKSGDALFFMRAGFSGVQRHCPLLWAGDQSVDFSRHDGIGTAVTAALSAGLVGNAYSHSDVGGYTSLHGNVRTEELMQRWYELGAFTPVMRTHEGNRPDDNLQIDSTPELLIGFARWSRVHAALSPWVKHLCDEASATGLPAQRALFLHYPADRATFSIQDQYLYGADLMVAPVIEQGARSRRVYLPGASGSSWVHIWSGRDYAPGWHDVASPIGHPPVFYRPESAFTGLFSGLAAVRDSL